MPPKKQAEPSKKTEMKKKEKIVEVKFMFCTWILMLNCKCTSQSPNSTSLVTSGHDTFDVSSSCILAVSSL